MMTLENRPPESPSESACPPDSALQEYIAGWADDEEADRIESHLAACRRCGQTLGELETHSDSLVQTVRQASSDDCGLADVEPDAEMAAAIERAGRLMEPSDMSPWEGWPSRVGELGPYELLHPLARGGMGAVYAARHRQLGKTVAIKLLPAPSTASRDSLTRFQREIRAAGLLDHPAIVAATDAGTQQGTHYLVMELVSGMDLSRLARHSGRLSVSDACELMRQTALGLSYAHAEGIVHRDIKPSNLMLDRHGQVKILDFGLAQLSFWDEAGAELTTVGQLLGTLDYMAPEQAEGGAVDHRVDLYGLGATLFRLLCGRAPLAATPHQSPLEKLRLLSRHTAPRLDTLRPDVPSDLADLAASLLAREPRDRPTDAANVAERLAGFCEPADLRGLLTTAQAAAEAEPRPTLHSPPIDPTSEKPQADPAGNVSSGRGSNRRRLIAAAAFPLFLFAGIVILLETQKGQLVIDSEVADVRVQLLKDGESIRELEIHPGATSTRLRADQYEIVIDSPSDSVRVENQQFELRRGQTVIARIRERPTAIAVDETIPPTASADEPLYDGRPLRQWEETLRRDRSPESIARAMKAMHAMLSPRTADRITEVLLDVLPQMKGELQITLPTELAGPDDVHSLDNYATMILVNANPGRKTFELVAREIEKEDHAWSERLLSTVHLSGQASSPADVEPLVAVLQRHVFAAESNAPQAVLEAAQHLIRNVAFELNRLENEELRHTGVKRLVELLEVSPRVDLQFWLRDPVDERWPDELRRAVWKHAAQTIKDRDSPPALVAQAAMILAGDPASTQDTETDLAESVNRRLVELADQPQRLLARVQVPESFHLSAMPRLKLPGNTHSSALLNQSPPVRADRTSFANEAMVLLDLVKVLSPQADMTAGLLAMKKATAEKSKAADELIPEGPPPRFPGFVHIDWPSLEFTTPRRLPPPLEEWVRALQRLSPDDVMAYTLHATAEEILAGTADEDKQ